MERSPITVLLPIRNGEFYLPDAIVNLRNCIGSGDEILVIDDGSLDKTALFLTAWSRENPLVRVMKNPGSGLVSALNFGLREATNSWIARVDVDDFYDTSRIQKQLSLVTSNVVAVFSDYALFHSRDRGLGTIFSAVSHPAVSVSLITSQRTAHSSVLFNRDAVISAGGYRQSDFPAEDLSLWLRLSRLGDLVSVPESLLKYRVSKGSISSNKQELMVQKKSEVLKKIGINPIDVLLFKEIFESILENYNFHANYNERKLLAYRDYFKLQESNLISNDGISIKSDFATWLLTSPRSQLLLSRMAFEKALRYFIR
jgi:glycosyltransferase involved in cell wall biosynthesis